MCCLISYIITENEKAQLQHNNIKTEKSLKDHLFIIYSLYGFSKKQIEVKKTVVACLIL